MPEDHFGERVAERFDERYAHKADPAVVDPIVAFLADLAGDGAALELGIGTGRIALPLARRGVRVHGIDLSEAMVARLRAKPGAEQIGVTIGDFATTTRRRHVLRRLPRRQHDHEPDDAGRAGRLLPERRRAPRAGRLLRDRGARSGAAAASARRDVPALRREPDPRRARRVRRGSAGPGLASLLDRRRQGRALLAAVPLRVAVGARPDGAARRDDAARALERLAARAVHEREHRSTSPSGRRPTSG